jgi:hypothetical protein
MDAVIDMIGHLPITDEVMLKTSFEGLSVRDYMFSHDVNLPCVPTSFQT